MRPLDPRQLATWRSDKMGKVTLFESERVLVGLNTFEPGQSHPLHAHQGQDKTYLVLEGRGRFRVGDEVHELDAGRLLVAPSGVPHAVENHSEERLLVLVTLSPPPGRKT